MSVDHLSVQAPLRIGLLATGNELTEGDILNTNGQQIARMLFDEGLTIGMHSLVSDAQQDIEQALNFLLEHHNCIIMTGGLGPTSDDRTRYALSTVINKSLIFNEASWQHFNERYQSLGLKNVPDESNRQQALFPESADVLINNHGSANGCKVIFKNKLIYMLPGPPKECLPMFQNFVLPELLNYKTTNLQKFKWNLLAAVESEIAAKVDAATKNFPVITGYRINQPYLEVKIYTEQIQLPIDLLDALSTLFKPHFIDESNKSASELLRESIQHFPNIIIINDKATHGALQVALTTVNTHHKLLFNADAQKDTLQIAITGLTEYWQGRKPGGYLELEIIFNHKDAHETDKILIPYWNTLLLNYAVEFICRRILFFIRNI